MYLYYYCRECIYATLVTVPLLDVVTIHWILDSGKKKLYWLEAGFSFFFWAGASTYSQVGVGDEVQMVGAGRVWVEDGSDGVSRCGSGVAGSVGGAGGVEGVGATDVTSEFLPFS